MKSWKKPTHEIIERVLGIKKEAEREYFFARLRNPLWIRPLVNRGCFLAPPKTRKLPGGYTQTPVWPELQYLKNVVRDVPDEVLEVVCELPEVDNPRVYDDIVDIALQLRGEQSAKLIEKVLESTEIDYAFSSGHRLAELLKYWTTENQFEAALKLAEVLVQFVPDRRDKTKRKRRRKNPTDTAKMVATLAKTQLEPSPRIDSWEYLNVLSEGVRPLAKKESYAVARILINATANMIRLRTHQQNLDNDADNSESWCERLTESEDDYAAAERSLVHTLTFACDQVYRILPDRALELDKTLREQRWCIFKRLRYHLYAQHPNKTTKPRIQDLIRKHEGYDWLEHRYEFQRMVRIACEQFGDALITKEECIRIFDSISSGPSKANYQVWVVDFLGEEFTEERFKEHTRRFHRMQFRPFERLLFGKYAAYFHDLQRDAETPISDDDYGPPRIQTSFGPNDHSPITPEDLANYGNEEILDFINQWNNEEVFYDRTRNMRVNIQGLSQAFETVFKKSIIPNANRLRFWMENFEKIRRPIFLERMLAIMQERIEAKNLDKLYDWLEFCCRVLIHTDHKVEDAKKRAEESNEIPEWYTPRRTVGDFIGALFEKNVDVPSSAYNQLTRVFDLLCTQSDWCLNRNLNQFTPFTQGLNCVRSRALQNLLNFGLWLRSHNRLPERSAVTRILETRFDRETQCPLTLPEYAILGVNFARIFSLNNEWSIKHKSDFFPQHALSSWIAAFESFVSYVKPFKRSFEILRDDYNFALQHLDEFDNCDDSEIRFIDNLGQHLFIYYLWDKYSLSGHQSLLKCYYDATEGNQEIWANLFSHVGRTLGNDSNKLDEDLIDKIYRFFEWRFEVREPVELQQFTYWLKAECLDPQWRLSAYSEILDITKSEDMSIHREVKALCDMLPDHTEKVVECFHKLTKDIGDKNLSIYTEEATTILQAGFRSTDHDVRQNAERARENLLRIGRFDLMELGN